MHSTWWVIGKASQASSETILYPCSRRRLDVPRQRRRIARHIDDPPRAQTRRPADDALARPRAGRVEHGEVGRHALRDERAQLAVDPVRAPLDVVEVLGVGGAVLDRARIPFDPEHEAVGGRRARRGAS